MSTEPEALRLDIHSPHNACMFRDQCRILQAENQRLKGESLGALFGVEQATVDHMQGMADRLRATLEQRAEDEKLLREVANELSNLHALVWGECPSLLNEDSGGDSAQDMAIRDALSNIRKRLGG